MGVVAGTAGYSNEEVATLPIEAAVNSLQGNRDRARALQNVIRWYWSL
jgi:hypothetical protein